MRFDGSLTTVNPINGSDVGLTTPPGTPIIPGMQVTGLFTIGPPFQPGYFQNTNNFIWQDTVSVVRGPPQFPRGW